MTVLDFAVVPFVKTDGPVTLGGLTLWSSTKAAWNARMGVDPPSLLEVYRGRDGRSLDDALSILSPAADAQASFGQYQDAIVVLSTADWLRGVSGTASDAWLFEPWRIDTANAFHTRAGKFSLNLTDPANDRLYPDPYTHPVRFVRSATEDTVRKLEVWYIRRRRSSDAPHRAMASLCCTSRRTLLRFDFRGSRSSMVRV